MGLISKTVIVKWNSNNKKWFVDKGYVFTKMSDEFEVKVGDLKNGSNALVYVECDCEICTTQISEPIRWTDYLKCVKEDSKYYCNKCSINIIGKYKILKTKLDNGVSIEQWCLDNSRQDILSRWDYNLNHCKPSEVNYKTSKKIYLKYPVNKHSSELKSFVSFANGNGSIDCKMCDSLAQWGIDNLGEDFLEKYWDYEKNIVNPWEIKKGSTKNAIFIKCQEKDYHGSYKTTCRQFSCDGRCPYCNKNSGKIHKYDSLGSLYPEVFNIWSDKNDISPYKYAPSTHNEVLWKCPEEKHEDYKRSIDTSNNCKFRCPECTRERIESILQEKVRLYVEGFGYTILHEHKCTIIPKNPKSKTNNTMPFDNEVVDLKLIIEIMGEQHYSISGFHKMSAKHNNTTPEYELHYQKVRDRYKRIFAKSQGYFYLEVPYWTNDKEETWKQLIDNKLFYLKGGEK